MEELTVSAVQSINSIIFTVRFYTLSFMYEWNKNPPEDQELSVYLANCKREALLLTQHEIDSWAQPVPIAI